MSRQLYTYRALHLTPKPRQRPDGDSMDVRVDLGMKTLHETRFRLGRINCPELSQPGGPEARDHMFTLWPHETWLECETFIDPTDKFGRWVAEVWLSDGRNLADTLVEAGHAHYIDYSMPHPGHRP